MRKANGFTIVEILIVVGIIGILSTIGFIGFGKYQADARDSERESKASIIVEALEKYYDKNGEYPSCSSLTGDPAVVTKEVLPGVEQQTLQAPQRPTGEPNSIECTDLVEGSSSDFFAYIGDSSPTCTESGGTACVLYQLKYKEESTGEIVTMNSRRKTGLSSTDVPNLTLSTISFTQVNTSWSAVSEAISYTLWRATDSGFTTNAVPLSNLTGTSQSVTGLSYGTTYFFKIRAVGIVGDGPWSPVGNATTWSLAKPVASATVNSGTQATFSWNAITHAASYTVEYGSNSDLSSATVQTGITTTSKAVTGITPGSTTYFRVKAVNGSHQGLTSDIISVITTVPAPTCLSSTVNSSAQITANWSACPVSIATSYTLQYSTDSNFASPTTITGITGTSRAVTGLAQGQTYYFRLYAIASGTSSAASPSAVATTTVNAPAAYSVSQSNGTGLTATANVTCPAGTVANYYWYANGGGWVTGTQYRSVTYELGYGQGITLSVNSRCQTSFAISGWIAGNNSVSYTRPGMGMTYSLGPDNCQYGFCGRWVTTNWTNICGTGSATMNAVQNGVNLGNWTSDGSNYDLKGFKGSSTGRSTTITANIGCAAEAVTVNVISVYG